MVRSIGDFQLRVTKSQITFYRDKAFAWVWIPGRYLCGKTAPLVLSISFTARDHSLRWKEVVESRTGWFMHHLELFLVEIIEDEVQYWIEKAWVEA